MFHVKHRQARIALRHLRLGGTSEPDVLGHAESGPEIRVECDGALHGLTSGSGHFAALRKDLVSRQACVRLGPTSWFPGARSCRALGRGWLRLPPCPWLASNQADRGCFT